MRRLHKAEISILKKECVHGDGLTAEGWAKNRRINDLSDELRVLRLAHQSLMMDARQVSSSTHAPSHGPPLTPLLMMGHRDRTTSICGRR